MAQTPAPLDELRIVHARAPGRVRYRTEALLRDPQLASRVRAVLLDVVGVERAEVSARTGSILVLFERGVRLEQLERVLCEVLDAAPPTARPSEPAIAATRRGPVTRTFRSAVARAAQPGTAQPGTAAQPASAEGPAFHALDVDAVCRVIGVLAPTGHDEASAAQRLAGEGGNALSEPERRSELRILVDQLKSTPVALLGMSAVLSVATGGVGDALAILAVVAINAGIGYVTESRSERTIAAITRGPAALVAVRRAGASRMVPLDAIVRGDLLELRAGVIVAADARLIEVQDLSVDESSLTGESVPTLKTADAIADAAAPLAERASMVYRGTLITGGSGLALVIAVGDETEIGRIQRMAGALPWRQTPMQQQLDQLGTQLALGASAACLVTFGIGLLRAQPALTVLRTAVSLGVAAVPESLPTVANTTLALGLARMRKERVIVRKLAAVETLGAVQVVCFDKTGTLTRNRMTAVELEAGLTPLRVGTAGAVQRRDGSSVSGELPDLQWLLRVAVLCNEVELREEHGALSLHGSPTEAALVQLALDLGCDVAAERRRHPLLDVQRRAQTRNYMTTLHSAAPSFLLAVKGRPSEVLALSSHCVQNGQRVPLSDAVRSSIAKHNEQMASRSLRVLGFAFLEQSEPHNDAQSELTWVGLIGMEDPPRHGMPELMQRFHAAGVRTVMITGDQSATAQAVGRQVGLAPGHAFEVVDSTRLDRIDPALLGALALHANVFSRVSPAHKLQIVQALQRGGQVVAMTGDGVNDGPALKAADIGIAMGASGTDAARAMSDIVLEDDELATLIIAIEQGRTIYEDIRKAVHFVLATNFSEILYTLAGVMGLGQPPTPIQLLWINLLTDVFPELALAIEPPERDVLSRPPRPPDRPMFARGDLLRVGGEGTIIALGALGAQGYARIRYGAGLRASTIGFTTLTLAQLLHAFSSRSERHSVFDPGHLARNPWLPAVMVASMGLQVAGNLVPGVRALLGTSPMGLADWSVVLAAAGAPFLVNEAIKSARSREPIAGFLPAEGAA